MLDYSDEEPGPRTVRKRGASPLRPLAAGAPTARGADDESPAVTQSIFKEFRERSSKLIMPTTNPPITNAFMVSEFIPGKLLKPNSEFDHFGLSFKGLKPPNYLGHSPLIHSLATPWVVSLMVSLFCAVTLDRVVHLTLDVLPFASVLRLRTRYRVLKEVGGRRGGGSSNKFSLLTEDHADSFYKSMRTLVFLAQFFAVFPVSGIRGSNYKSLVFKWAHHKTAYWGLSFLGTVFCFVCSVASGFYEGLFQAASGIFYFACGILSSLLMLSLSRNWRNLNREFANVEVKFKKYGYPKKIGLKFKVFTIAFLVVGLVEHVLAKMKSFKTINECSKRKHDFYTLARTFFLAEYSEVFSLVPYGLWKGVTVFIAHFLVTANWNFKDLFLCLISWTIGERFKQVHELLDKVHGQDKSVSFWKEVREDFNSLSVLTKRVDTYIRKLMFLSIGNNLFFICIQLFHSLKKKLDLFRLIYFFWSFGFLVLRTGFVAFSAARINDESKEPKTILYSVPQTNYTAEVRRFLTQLTTNEVALTGSGFFSITRSLILTIIGSVITYEIVLVQFGSKDDDLPANSTICLYK